jgi:predicted GNAT family acetyltransferase
MIDNLLIRKATVNDMNFIIETILEADKSGTSISSTCNILNILEKEYRTILRDILKENVEGQEFSLSGFLVAELNDEPIGALGSWVEGVGGIPSHLLYSTLLLHHMKRENIPGIIANFRVTKELSFRREENSIQFEYGYVRDKFRRKGVYTRLMIESIKKHYPSGTTISKAQGICFKKNIPSLNSALKLGFHEVETKISSNEQLMKLFPYNEKILVEMNQKRLAEVTTL